MSFDYKPVYPINNASLPNQQNDPPLPLGTNHVSRQLIAEMCYVRKVALNVKCGNSSDGPKATIVSISLLAVTLPFLNERGELSQHET